MSDRPTPEQIAAESQYYSPTVFLGLLHDHGYVIVHPDDVPAVETASVGRDWGDGWNACRDHIFGGDQ